MRPVLAAIALLPALAALAALAACSKAESREAPAAPDATVAEPIAPAPAPLPAPACAEADCLPGFRLADIDGKERTTDELRGKPTLVMFWASYCEPCLADGPTLSGLYAKGGFAVLALSRDESDDATMHRFRDHYGLAYPIARVDPATFAAFGAPETIPTFLLYDAGGKQVARFTGALPAGILERELAALAAPQRK